MKKIVLATHNAGKLKELTDLLSPLICIGQQDLAIPSPEETGHSFIENALLKARHASRLSDKPALADDSGLVVPALGGAPGIYSARYAGLDQSPTEHLHHLLQNMQDFQGQARNAFFYCVIVLMRHAFDPMPFIACGQLHGSIAQSPSGDHGFGYDPIFYLADYQCTLAEVSPALKNTISHRAKALQQLQQQLRDAPL